ncbi:hypothetical protein HPB50_004791 [Hyalomma asiaticum]|uniref:Uncharacterized protein n=1 Tax=Hyalomma asiaticum TaxID=266040 RepID=A0ACB7SJA1_HYAAI|nr:hypothetical protein HPB50_004791 [Hyalomma asiaticum]
MHSSVTTVNADIKSHTDAERRRKDAEDAHRRLKEEEKRKMEEKERKKAEKEQERKAEQRRKIISERVGQPKPLDGANEATLQGILKQYHARIAALEDAKYDLEYEVRQKDFVAICKEYYERLCKLESEKYDTEYLVRQKDYEINELTIQVNDLRGKLFDKLKMVAKSTSEVDFRSNLKSVKKDAFKLDEEKQTVKKDVPEWAAK